MATAHKFIYFLLQAIPPFLTLFSTAIHIYLKYFVVMRSLCGNGLNFVTITVRGDYPKGTNISVGSKYSNDESLNVTKFKSICKRQNQGC